MFIIGLRLSLYIMSSCLRRYSVRHELNTLDACWIAFDVWSNSSRCRKYRSNCLGRDAYMYDHSLDIVMTLHGSINCSTVICSPTVIFAIMREASREHYGPQGLLHTIFSALHFYFVSLSALRSHLAINCEGIDNPFIALGASFCVCAGS